MCSGRGYRAGGTTPERGSLEYLVEDYDRIRNDIEAVLPESPTITSASDILEVFT